ncbi:MAG TPA: hypothetical protein DEA97_12890 [Bacteroidales bacterium]|nr:hypothetical protein [Bacteroidales bacterium]
MKKLFLLLTLAFSLCTSHGQDYHKIDSLKQILKTLPELDGTDADTTRMKVCLDIGDLYENFIPDSAIWWYQNVADTVLSVEAIRQFRSRSVLKATANRNVGIIAYSQGNYPEAFSFYGCSLKIDEELDNKDGVSKSLVCLGNAAYYQGNYSDALSFYGRSLKISEEIRDKSLISMCLINLGNIALNQGNYSDALSFYGRSLKISEELGNKSRISICLNNLGVVVMNQGNYTDALSFYSRSLKISEEQGNKDGISECLNNLGLVKMYQGNYSNAVSFYEQSMKIKEELGNKAGIPSCLMNLGVIAFNQGNYSDAISFYEHSLKISEELNDKSLISMCLNNMGITAMYQGNFFDALSFYGRSLIIFEELGDKLGLSMCLNNLGLIKYNQGNYSDALSFYGRSLIIFEELDNKNGISMCLNNLGVVSEAQGNYSDAISFYGSSLKISEELGNKTNLANWYSSIAKIYLKTGQITLAPALLQKSLNLTFWLLKDNFSTMSEDDKELYLERTKSIFNDINSFYINYPGYNDSLSGTCYNNELILKGLLLKSTQTILDAVYTSQDTALKNTYFLLKQYRDQATSLQGSEEISRDSLIADFENKANEQERKLVKLSSEFANIQNLFNYKWEDVQKNLKPNEAAIEFVSFTQGINNDTTVYAALLITSESKKPASIKLFEDSQLQKIINAHKGDDYQKVSKLYGTNQNINNELYNLIWQPLEQHLTGIKTVFFAPVRVLNKISFSALGDGKQLLCDKYNLQQVSSTGKLINQEPFSLQGNLTAAVFGGIDFNPDSAETQNLASLWQYLPGTLSEKENVQKQLKKKKVAVKGFAGKEATEPAFKSLYAENGASPDILHIATHGFFYPDPEQVKKEKTDATERGGTVETGDIAFRGATGCATWQFVENKNPMMRSGLALAGANRVWTQEWGRTDDEGVLTALEVSHLNMKNTDLVVLSACETGLGDIKGSEGVYGLQRAFKMAGVKYIIMSLWQVPDKETQEFMTLFYSKLLKIKDVRNAFVETQKEMRAKYDPYFWGAFVLVE